MIFARIIFTEFGVGGARTRVACLLRLGLCPSTESFLPDSNEVLLLDRGRWSS